MVSAVVKINKMIMYVIFTIVIFSLILLSLAFIKSKSNLSPEKYLKSLGYKIEYIGEKQVSLPKKFGDGLNEYNKLQKKQGFDLKKYSGKECIQKKYYVSSKKYNSEQYVANVLAYKNKVIGGDIHKKYYEKGKQEPLPFRSIK